MTLECPKCQTNNPEDSKFCKECATPFPGAGGAVHTKTLETPIKGISEGAIIAGKYKIIEVLGRGGMGVVYKAEDTKLKRTVALKFLPVELTKENEAKNRFIQEAQAAAALNHPQICTIYEVDEADNQMFIAMEYIDGPSLKDKLESGPLNIDEAKDIVSQVAEGLKVAHEKGIIHRDIKPANIMLTEKGQVKITDFGLAKISWGIDLTKTSTIMGTVAYMSPEQAKGEEVDHRTDIWALGAMLYEILTGERPFQKSQEHALIYAIINEKPKSITTIRSDIPTSLTQVIEKALAKKVNQRYQSVFELLQGLKQALSITLPKAEKSIIVLPFKNLSPDPEQEYFCDGMTEEIITDLSHIQGLLVISRSSAMTFKGMKKKIREIAGEVNVEYVLEGSVRKAGNNLRITAQLIDATSDNHIWADKYKGTLDDFFDIQEKVSRSIVDALKLKLNFEEKQRIAERPIENVAAYECYLKANVEIWKFTEDGLNCGIRYLQDGLNIIGDNALLYSGMAYAILQLVNIGAKQEKDLAKSEEIAKKALALDPESPKANAILGWIACWENPRQVIHHFKKALSLNPDDSFTLQGLLIYYIQEVGDITAATSIIERLKQIDPLHFGTSMLHGLLHFYDGAYKLALPLLRRLYDLYPENPILLFYYASTMVYLSKIDQAVVIIDKSAEATPGNAFSKQGLMLKHAVRNEKDRVFQEMTSDLRKTCKRDITFSHHLAGIFSLVGAKKEALDWLENAVHRGFINYPLLSKKDHFLENIRGEPRFKKLMERVKYEWENLEG